MEHCFWIILAVMTGLTGTQKQRFNLIIQKGNSTKEYYVSKLDSLNWQARHEAGSQGDSVTVSYKVSADFMTLTSAFVNDTISLTEIFAVKEINWEKVKRLNFQKQFKDEGEGPLHILRTANRIDLSQKSGSFTYFPVIYASWR